MNIPAFESNGSFDGIISSEHRETSLTELLPPLSSPDVMTPSSMTPSRSTSRRPSALFLSVDHSEMNNHSYVYDSTRSLNGMTVIMDQ